MEMLRAKRREAGRQSPAAFARIYMTRHVKKAPSAMHEEIFELLRDITVEGRGGRIAIAAPRGHAKSTIVSTAYVLWCICYELERYILIVSDTSSQANDQLEHVKRELESNLLLQMDFPDVCETPGVRPGPPRWRQDEIVTRNDVRVQAFGATKKIRGRRYKQHRPSLIVVDDLENEEQTASQDRREKLRNWFEKSLLKSGDELTNVVVVGTVMHYDALLATLVDDRKSPRWTGRVYRAVLKWSDRTDLWETWEAIYTRREESEGQIGPKAAEAFFEQNRREMLAGTEVLWPEHEGYYQLMVQRASEGRASFDSEKQNEPIDPRDCLFREDDIVYWDDKYSSLDELKAEVGRYHFFGACDPSLGKQGKNRDDSAIVTLLRDRKNGTLYVVDADIARRPPDQTITTILSYQELRKYERFAIECNQFQDYMADELNRRSEAEGAYMSIKRITNKGDKMGRIQKLQPLVKSGAIQFSRKHRLLLDQLRQFPKAAHDDGPDALEMAVEVAKKGGGCGIWAVNLSGDDDDYDDDFGEGWVTLGW